MGNTPMLETARVIDAKQIKYDVYWNENTHIFALREIDRCDVVDIYVPEKEMKMFLNTKQISVVQDSTNIIGKYLRD